MHLRLSAKRCLAMIERECRKKSSKRSGKLEKLALRANCF